MSDSVALKLFALKISRKLNENDLSKFASQLSSFCYEKNVPIPPGLNKDSSFLDLMNFAFQQSLITPQNTHLLTRLLYSAGRLDLSEELCCLEKTFLQTQVDPNLQNSCEVSCSIPICKHASEQQNINPDIIDLFSNLQVISHFSSESEARECCDNILLTEAQVMSYCSEIPASEWKQLANLGFKLTSSQIERIDYDCKTLQDKVITIFSVWKNLSLASPYYPPFTKLGFKQALIVANLNGLARRLYL